MPESVELDPILLDAYRDAAAAIPHGYHRFRSHKKTKTRYRRSAIDVELVSVDGRHQQWQVPDDRLDPHMDDETLATLRRLWERLQDLRSQGYRP